jgi:hypothetical protein
MSEKIQSKPDELTWREACKNHFLLFGYWMANSQDINSLMQKKSKKQIILAILNTIFCSLIVSVAFQGILDGPEILSNYLQLNFTTWSKTLFDWAIITYIFLFVIIFGVGFVFPYILFYILQKIKQRKNPNFTPLNNVILASYAVFPILFYTQLIYIIMIFSVWESPQLIHIQDAEWWNYWVYIFGGLVVLSLIIMLKFIKIISIKHSKSESVD